MIETLHLSFICDKGKLMPLFWPDEVVNANYREFGTLFPLMLNFVRIIFLYFAFLYYYFFVFILSFILCLFVGIVWFLFLLQKLITIERL